MEGGAWWDTVHGVAKSRTRLSDFTSLHYTRILRAITTSCPTVQPLPCICLPFQQQADILVWGQLSFEETEPLRHIVIAFGLSFELPSLHSGK